MKINTKTILICIIAEALNFISDYFFYNTLQLPLFMDTIFTIAVTFYCGLIPGLVVAVFYNVISSLTFVIRDFSFDPFSMLFAICGCIVVLVTWFFARNKEDFKISRGVTLLYLLLMALISSFLVILSSGIIDYVRFSLLDIPDRIAPIKNFTDSFVEQKFSLFAACILGQIPISVTDRLITTFLGYGTYRGMVALFGEEHWSDK